MIFNPPKKARCIDAGDAPKLVLGLIYEITEAIDEFVFTLGSGYSARRFEYVNDETVAVVKKYLNECPCGIRAVDCTYHK